MISREHNHIIVGADLLVQEVEELTDRTIGPHRYIADLRGIRSERMANPVVSRKTDRKHVGNVVSSQLFAFDRRLGKQLQQIVVERRPIESV